MGKVSDAGHFPPQVPRRLKRLADNADTTDPALLRYALHNLFARHGLR